MNILQLENFKDNLINVINNSNLSISEGYWVLKSIFQEIEKLYIEEKYSKIINNNIEEKEDFPQEETYTFNIPITQEEILEYENEEKE